MPVLAVSKRVTGYHLAFVRERARCGIKAFFAVCAFAAAYDRGLLDAYADLGHTESDALRELARLKLKKAEPLPAPEAEAIAEEAGNVIDRMAGAKQTDWRTAKEKEPGFGGPE